MLASTDVTAIVTVIGASAAAIVSIIVAIRQQGIHTTTADTNRQVATSNGETLASIVEGNDLRTLDPKNPPPKPATEGGP